MKPIVLFSHGKESGPHGYKIVAMRAIATEMGFDTESIDYRDLKDPDARVARCLDKVQAEGRPYVLVGSSMGGYVSAVVSHVYRPSPLGVFLMAPAVYLPGYSFQDVRPVTPNLVVVHGKLDTVVPMENVSEFVKRTGAQLFTVADDHHLKEAFPYICQLFKDFLKGLTG